MADNTSTNMSTTHAVESTPAAVTTPAPSVVGPLINQQVYLWFTVAVFVIGLGGNIIVVVAFMIFKKLRSLGSVFIVNTAVSDILVGLLGDLFIIVGIATHGEYLINNKPLCDMSSFLCASVCIVSVWSIAAASFNGYIRVCHHLAYAKIYTPATVGLMLLGIWSAGILILLPTLFGWGSHYYDPVLMFCIPSSTSSVSYTFFMVFTGWGIPLVVIVFSFTRIILTVRASSKNLKKGEKGVSKGEMAVIRSVMVIAVYFFAAYLFLLIILLMGDNYGGSAASIVFAVVLAHTHCSFTGILYAMTNKRYRTSYKRMFYFCWHRGKVGVELTTSSGSSGGGMSSTVSGAVTGVTNA
ncbi:melatonin receptor type 1B-B-like [Amphiura filiformis]|uniref:melatonin receptor type 1B-B-like n=1 Tax=Amphiura filiformis TaxID=82378 RepID=UPI003B21F62B